MSKKTENTSSGESSASRKLPSKEEIEELRERLAVLNTTCLIKHKVIVLSGKGGVGKSTVAANLAVALAMKGKQVGLMDVDVHGPSIPKLLGLEGTRPIQSPEGLTPIRYSKNLKVVSIGFLLQNSDDAVIWRAPLKHSLIRQFLTDVKWGQLDYLIVDCPPGTGDEPLSVIQLLEDADGAIVVTTPQDVALADVRKSITFCRQTNLPVIGIVENMSGFVCPHCGETVDIFKSGGGEKMASDMDVSFICSIPIEPKMVESGDSGKPFMELYAESETARAFDPVVERLLEMIKAPEA
jgi:Mrp family chromosome partitioning ATPase